MQSRNGKDRTIFFENLLIPGHANLNTKLLYYPWTLQNNMKCYFNTIQAKEAPFIHLKYEVSRHTLPALQAWVWGWGLNLGPLNFLYLKYCLTFQFSASFYALTLLVIMSCFGATRDILCILHCWIFAQHVLLRRVMRRFVFLY